MFTQKKQVGLGLRTEFIHSLYALDKKPCDFLEIAPENWLHLGGRFKAQLQAYADTYPLVAHGLSLSLGSPAPLDKALLRSLKVFLDSYHIDLYSEHLSYCSDEKGQLYDLLPIPFTEEAVHYVASRIKQVQNFLEQRIAIENASFYSMVCDELSEIEFINAVIHEADCDLLLDVNNVYVNSVNHNYCPYTFLAKLPLDKVTYVHIAGHDKEHDKLLIDTHGADVCKDVWQLLAHLYQQYDLFPTLLERDNCIPPLDELLKEVQYIKLLQNEFERVS